MSSWGQLSSAGRGETLDLRALEKLVSENPGITCISLMGGDADPAYVGQLCSHIRTKYPGLKTCWYSGRGLSQAGDVLPWLDYIKVGPWIEEFGPLDNPATNQRFYAVFHDAAPSPAADLPAGIRLEDRTSRFLKKVF